MRLKSFFGRADCRICAAWRVKRGRLQKSDSRDNFPWATSSST